MAKKLKFGRRINLDHLVSKLYDRGITQSCIIHTAVLLLLSLIVEVPVQKNTPIVITLSTATIEKDIDYTDSNEQIMELVEQIEHQPGMSDPTDDIVNSSNIDQNNESVDISDLLASVNDNSNHINDEAYEFDRADLQQELPIAKQAKDSPSKKPPVRTRQYTSNTSAQGSGQAPLGTNGTGTDNRNNADIAELEKRLQQFGAQAGDIQISLSWNTIDDIDLHVCVLPIQSQINWTSKRGACGGMLDIDMNAHAHMVSDRPIENIFWPNQKAPQGVYIVGIQNYMPWSRNLHTQVLVVVKNRGQVIYSEKMIARYGEGVKEVFRFNFK